MEHFYQNIGEDWMDYQELYSEMVNHFTDDSHFVEIGSWKGRSSSYMAVEIYNSRILNLIESVPVIQTEGFSGLQLRFSDESPETVRTIVEAFVSAGNGTLRDGQFPFRQDIHTTGSYKRGVE